MMRVAKIILTNNNKPLHTITEKLEEVNECKFPFRERENNSQ